jgi:hypothetical protein
LRRGSLLDTDAFYEGIPARQIIEERIALKEREYFIANGVSEVIPPDEGDDPATAYRKASRGG